MADHWSPGQTIGQYGLVRELARGGMGEIWLANQHGTAGFARRVVLKRLLQHDDDPSAFTMFVDEARIVAHLQHPNIVQVFDFKVEGGSHFLVMEYLAGQMLSSVAKRMALVAGPLPVRLSVGIVSAAARGLGYAHQRTDPRGHALTIVHRDVSPQNVFVTYEGEVKVLDFGIARAEGRMAKTGSGIVKGKLAYMAPEQALGEPLTAAADVYALGVILYELLTGSRFYQGLDEVGMFRRLSSRTPPDASALALVDPELTRIVLRMLTPVAAERLADGQVVHEALEHWLSNAPHVPGERPLAAIVQGLFLDEIKAHDAQAPGLVATTPSSNMPDLTVAVAPASVSQARGRLALGLAALVGASLAAVVLSRRGEPLASLADASAALRPEAPDAAVAQGALDAGAARAFDAGVAHELDAGVASPVDSHHRAPVATGRLSLDSDPWTRVSLGSRVLGDTPLLEVPLTAGTHRLKLVNVDEHLSVEVEVVIKAGETTVKRLVF